MDYLDAREMKKDIGESDCIIGYWEMIICDDCWNGVDLFEGIEVEEKRGCGKDAYLEPGITNVV